MKTPAIYPSEWASHWRPRISKALGCHLLPTTVTSAWYASECDNELDMREMVGTGTYLQWRLSIWLRGIYRVH